MPRMFFYFIFFFYFRYKFAHLPFFRLLKLLNTRFMEKLKEYWVVKKIKCPKIEDQQDGIPISNIGGVFIVIFVGIALAICVLIFEFWWFRYHHRLPANIITVAEYVKPEEPRVNSAQQGPSGLFNSERNDEMRFRAKDTTNIQIAD